MTATITGNGIDKVQDGTIQSADLASGVPSRSQLPAGTVLQVVQGSTELGVSSTSSTYADTGLTATITPTSATSKILVFAYQNSNLTTAQTGIMFRLLRNGSQISFFEDLNSYSGSGASVGGGSSALSYLDSPATTSAVTYKVQFANRAPAGTVYIQYDNAMSTITLMEIAA